MRRVRGGRIGVALLGALAAAWAAPAASQAATFCFPNQAVDPACTPANTNASLQAALAQAAAAAGGDTLLIGAGTHPLPLNAGTNSPDTLQIVGKGTGATTLAMTDTTASRTGLSLGLPAGSTIRDLSLTIPANADGNGDAGMLLGDGITARNVSVTGPDASNATAIRLSGSTALENSTIDLQLSNPVGNLGVDESGGSPSIADTEITADYGVRHSSSGSTTTVSRSTLHARFYGVSGDSGTSVVRNTVIDLEGQDNAVGVLAANFNNGSVPIATQITGSTIVNGGQDSIGVQAVGDSSNAGEDSTASVNSTVISGVTTPLYVGADNGDTATMTTSYSNYDAAASFVDPDLDDMAPAGTATLTATDKTNLAPGFVNPAAGDFRLVGSSPLIDIGDPAAPLAGETDRLGAPRAFTPRRDYCTNPPPPVPQRRDIGAYEFTNYATPAIGCPVPCPLGKCGGDQKVKKCKAKKGKKRAGASAKKKRKCKPKKKPKK